jgi:hypothetical protein
VVDFIAMPLPFHQNDQDYVLLRMSRHPYLCKSIYKINIDNMNIFFIMNRQIERMSIPVLILDKYRLWYIVRSSPSQRRYEEIDERK